MRLSFFSIPRRGAQLGGLALACALLALSGCNRGGGASPAASAASAAKPLPALSLLPTDLLQAQTVALERGVEVSGSLRAARSAWVKAKVPGELLSLNVREGEAVRAGQVLGQIDTQEAGLRLAQAQQQAAQARAQWDIANRTWANNQALVAQGFISPTALETSASSQAAAKAALAAAEAAVALARKAQGDATLVAPMDGWVSQRLAQAGERVAVEARIVEVVDLRSLELEAQVAPADVARLQIGAAAVLTLEGSPTPLAARLVRISPSAVAGARTVPAYLALAPHPALRQGLFARGVVSTPARWVLALPLSAVRTDQALPYVIKVVAAPGAAGAAQARHQTVGLGERGAPAAAVLAEGTQAWPWVEINQGLAEGDAVLAAATGLVADGTPLKLPVKLPVSTAHTAAHPTGPTAAPAASAATSPAAGSNAATGQPQREAGPTAARPPAR